VPALTFFLLPACCLLPALLSLACCLQYAFPSTCYLLLLRTAGCCLLPTACCLMPAAYVVLVFVLFATMSRSLLAACRNHCVLAFEFFVVPDFYLLLLLSAI
jgi:hypothetical protein